ncbi:MAG: hypothetical protein ACYDHH_05630 [Solirubrobacteraceae bacterium]
MRVRAPADSRKAERDVAKRLAKIAVGGPQARISHPAYKRPDPRIYSPRYLAALPGGEGATWDNPDISLLEGDRSVPLHTAQPGHLYTLVASLRNGSDRAPVVGLTVRFSYAELGIGTERTLIAATTITLGVSGQDQAQASCTWTPIGDGPFSIFVDLDWIDDAEPRNNHGEWATVDATPDCQFVLRNATSETRTYSLRFDREPPPGWVLEGGGSLAPGASATIRVQTGGAAAGGEPLTIWAVDERGTVAGGLTIYPGANPARPQQAPTDPEPSTPTAAGFRHFTHARDPEDHRGDVKRYVIFGIVLGLVLGFGLFALAAWISDADPVRWWGLLGVIVAVLVVGGLIVAYWWLEDRLLSLGAQDVCAIGLLLSAELPLPRVGVDALDTDNTLNVVLAPGLIGQDQETAASLAQGGLVAETGRVAAAGLPFQGHLSIRKPGDVSTAVLHCEFEGAGMAYLAEGLLVALPLALAEPVLCGIRGVSWVIPAVVAILAAGIGVVAIVRGIRDDRYAVGKAGNSGVFQSGDQTGIGADIVFVKGAWIYDSAHLGWNEIHPIKHCQRIGTWNGSWDGMPDPLQCTEAWRRAVDSAQAAGRDAGRTGLSPWRAMRAGLARLPRTRRRRKPSAS